MLSTWFNIFSVQRNWTFTYTTFNIKHKAALNPLQFFTQYLTLYSYYVVRIILSTLLISVHLIHVCIYTLFVLFCPLLRLELPGLTRITSIISYLSPKVHFGVWFRSVTSLWRAFQVLNPGIRAVTCLDFIKVQWDSVQPGITFFLGWR